MLLATTGALAGPPGSTATSEPEQHDPILDSAVRQLRAGGLNADAEAGLCRIALRNAEQRVRRCTAARDMPGRDHVLLRVHRIEAACTNPTVVRRCRGIFASLAGDPRNTN
jgi:hypothetical protein